MLFASPLFSGIVQKPVNPLGAIIVNKLTIMMVAFALLSGCATPPQRLDQTLEPDALWQRAERQNSNAMRAVAERHQLQSDYTTIIRLSRNGDLRGRAFVRLAELNVALWEYDEARHNLEQSLRAELSPEHRRRALLMLGDLMERHLRNRTDAATAYRQIINEHPATPETELARLRLGALSHER